MSSIKSTVWGCGYFQQCSHLRGTRTYRRNKGQGHCFSSLPNPVGMSSLFLSTLSARFNAKSSQGQIFRQPDQEEGFAPCSVLPLPQRCKVGLQCLYCIFSTLFSLPLFVQMLPFWLFAQFLSLVTSESTQAGSPSIKTQRVSTFSDRANDHKGCEGKHVHPVSV